MNIDGQITNLLTHFQKKYKKFSLFGKENKKNKIWRNLMIGIVGLFTGTIIFLTGTIIVLSVGLPDVKNIENHKVAQSTTIFDRNGEVLYVKYGDEDRQYVTLDMISETLINATISIEDDEFWNHHGFDIPGITKAAMYEFFGIGERRGGSTITQQYIKLAFLSSERSYIRKIKEIILAVRLESAFDKEAILEMYLNKISYGNNAYGIQKASNRYFGKDAKYLDLAESAILASLPNAPTYWSPYGVNKNSELLISDEQLHEKNICTFEQLVVEKDYKLGLLGKEIKISPDCEFYLKGRANLILDKMMVDEIITENQRKEAEEKIINIEFNQYRDVINAPHFVFYVLQELQDEYGKERLEQGGLMVYTTLDFELQRIAEEAVVNGVNKSSWYNVTNGSLVSLDPNTGEILAMVGSKDYYDESIDGNVNIATSYRQPGSSFKPYVYAQTFYNGYTPSTFIKDEKTKFGANSYPNNYDGKFKGLMTIRQALAQSRNIPAIKAYFLAGEEAPILDIAEKMGINFLSKDIDYGWPLALGTAEVRLLDHTIAYGVFANGGNEISPVSILRVENADGSVIKEFKRDELRKKEVIDPQIAYLITSILSDEKVRLGKNLTLQGQVNAAKTGTSNKKINEINYPNNLWTMGYTTHLVTGVWVGNSNDKKSGNISVYANGYDIAAPIWKQFMDKAHALKGFASDEFPIPDGIYSKVVKVPLSAKITAEKNAKGDFIDYFASFSR